MNDNNNNEEPSEQAVGEAPATKGRRFFKLASMTASVATRYATTQLRGVFSDAEGRARNRAESNRRSGEQIAETLGQLKGAAMKIGQMASIGSDMLPKELADALVSLQKEAPPMPFEIISDQIESEFGSPPASLFNWFDERPFAAASIGQVHRATTDDGRDVVVKVQYPGVDSSVDSDLNHLKFALRASGLLSASHKESLNLVFEELRERLHEELDYTIESDSVRKFREFHKNHDFLIVPDVVGERSSQRVLTLTYEPGTSFQDMLASDWSQDTRNKIGENLVKMLISQVFELGTIHADPNPGNFAFHEDGRVVLYDFGCVKTLHQPTLEAWKHTLQNAVRENYEEVEQGLRALGARNLDGPEIEPIFYKTFRDILIQPFHADDQPFEFESATIHEDLRHRISELLKRLKSFQAPPELVFLDRAIGGHYGMLRQMGAIGDYYPLLAPKLGLEPHEQPR